MRNLVAHELLLHTVSERPEVEIVSPPSRYSYVELYERSLRPPWRT